MMYKSHVTYEMGRKTRGEFDYEYLYATPLFLKFCQSALTHVFGYIYII